MMVDKSHSALFTKSARSGAPDSVGTRNPRYLRVLQALANRALSRNEVDMIAGTSNGPQLVSNLRALGLALPCRLTPGIDRDGKPIRFGVYSLSSADRNKISKWQREPGRNALEGADEK